MLIIAITAAPRRTRRARPTRHDRNHRRAEPPMPQRARRRCRSMPQSAVGDNAVMVSAMCELVSVCFDRNSALYIRSTEPTFADIYLHPIWVNTPVDTTYLMVRLCVYCFSFAVDL